VIYKDLENKEWKILEKEIVTCAKCTRLVEWREYIAKRKRKSYLNQEYWGKPVPGFGDLNAKILIIGLAPGAHGSNRTGRMFTGDASGNFLFPALFRAGFANQPAATHINDGLKLNTIYISAVCKCVPPENKPISSELSNCQEFLVREIHLLKQLQGIVALGQIAFKSILKIYRNIYSNDIPTNTKFSHLQMNSRYKNMPWILASYHPSQQNTATGRLSRDMFDNVWKLANQNINKWKKSQ